MLWRDISDSIFYADTDISKYTLDPTFAFFYNGASYKNRFTKKLYAYDGKLASEI